MNRDELTLEQLKVIKSYLITQRNYAEKEYLEVPTDHKMKSYYSVCHDQVVEMINQISMEINSRERSLLNSELD